MDDSIERKSRTQIKKEMLSLQKLGERLVSLSTVQINNIDMEEALKEAILFAKNIRKHGARKRQMQYIGALMREADISSIQKSLELIELGQRLNIQQVLKIEKWRDELISGNREIFNELSLAFPDLDRQHLNQLIRNAQHEEKTEKPPKSSRALYQYLRDLSESEES